MAAIQNIIPCEQIKLDEQLGRGQFAEVKRGKWLQSSGQEVAVAVKILFDTSPNSAADLRNEMSHLKKLQHQYIVRFHGFVAQPPMLVFEFCEGGSLLDSLRDKNKPIPLVSSLHDYCIQIAEALLFLESKHCVHRDVAARNILLAKDGKTAKLGDFGLTRTLDDDEDIYVMMSHTKVPFPWCPPEALRYGEFSHASDVWAFGVTIWEIFTFGEEPWVGCRPIDVLKNIDAGERLVKPTYCSENIYRIMKDCWKSNPAERCKFGAIREDLKASMFLDAIARETYHSIQPGTLQLVKEDEVVVVENTGQDWFGQNKKNQKFGTFPRSVVFARSKHAVAAASAVTPQKAPTAPTAPIPSHSTTSVSETPTSQQQNPLQKALTDELKGNLNRRPTSAGSTGNGSPLHRNGVSKVSQPISQQPLPPQVVPTNQAPKLSQPQQVKLPPPVTTAPIANSHNGMTRPRQASAIGKQNKNGGNGRTPPASIAPTPAAHASPPRVNATQSAVNPRPAATSVAIAPVKETSAPATSSNWKEFTAVSGIEANCNSVFKSISFAPCCMQKHNEDKCPASTNCTCAYFESCLNFEKFHSKERIKKAYFMEVGEGEHICMSCHGWTGCQMPPKTKKSTSTQLFLQNAADHLVKVCKTRTEAYKGRTANCFIFRWSKEGVLYANNQFNKNGGRFDFRRFDALLPRQDVVSEGSTSLVDFDSSNDGHKTDYDD